MAPGRDVPESNLNYPRPRLQRLSSTSEWVHRINMETRLHTFQAFGTPKPLPRCVRGTKRSFYGRGHTLDTSCLACQTATRAARRHAGSRPWGAWPRAVGHQRSTRPSPGPRRSRAEAPSTCRRPRHSLCHHGSKQVARPMRPAPLRCMSLMATHISCKLQMSLAKQWMLCPPSQQNHTEPMPLLASTTKACGRCRWSII